MRLADFGRDIINSITIHKLEGDSTQGIESDVVALLTSNDQTIRIYSLTQGRDVDSLHLEFPVNHATISPDGNTLVAVGDYQRAYFFENMPLHPSQFKASSQEKYASNHIQWLELRLVDLHVAQPTPVIGYFATAWASSSAYCAVASECGYITIISMEAILNSSTEIDPISASEVAVFISPSSRPDVDNGPGAVRAMLFSPAPFDLLVWIEGQGRVCVADLRNGLRTRQVINLDAREKGLVKVHHETASDVPTIVHNRSFIDDTVAYEAQGHSSYLASSMGGFEEYLLPRNRLLRVLQANSAAAATRASSALSPDIEFIATFPQGTSDTSRLRDQRTSRNSTYSHDADEDAHFQTGSPFSEAGHRYGNVGNSFPSEAELSRSLLQEHHSERYAYSGELTPDERDLMDSLTSASHLVNDRPRSIQYGQAAMEDRQASDHAITVLRTISNNRAANQLLSISPPIETAFQIIPGTRFPTHAYSDNSELVRHVGRSDPMEVDGGERSTVAEPSSDINNIRLRRQIDRARERSDRLRRAGQLNARTQNLVQRRLNDSPTPAYGVSTQGLCISPDGRTMWVGTTEGIYELRFNLHARLQFPSIDMR